MRDKLAIPSMNLPTNTGFFSSFANSLKAFWFKEDNVYLSDREYMKQIVSEAPLRQNSFLNLNRLSERLSLPATETYEAVR